TRLQTRDSFLILHISQIGILAFDPILTRRDKDVIGYQVFFSFCFMPHVRRYVQHFIGTHPERLTVYVEPPHPAHYKRQLLVLMVMRRHVAPLFALHPRDHHCPIPGQLANELVIDPLLRNLVPFEMLHHLHHQLVLLRASDSTTVWL